MKLRFDSPRGPRRYHVLLSLLIAAILYLSADIVAAENFTNQFDAANKLYEQNKFSEAAAAYENMIQSGSVSPALYFNLGNAFFKSSQIGRAVVAYRQAEQLAPRDPDVRANLQFARNQIQGPTLAPNRLERWLGKLTANEWAVLAAVAGWLCLLSLALIQLRPALKLSLRSFAMGSGAATLALGACLGAVLLIRSHPTVIVITHDAAVRSGPLDESQILFKAHDGAELAVLDAKDEWLQISAGQQGGWLKRAQTTSFLLRRTN